LLPNRSSTFRGKPMKKNLPARWSLWNWLLGSGGGNGGASG
jgi:hypothetical protein